ncbi:ABC transporter permease subunit [Solibaculum mannosilyticum]|uniref:ABC transporter permease subunit n=1 Tax=Solibaculum mannosilyticum TaxID=2780922 RepID=UPI0034B17AA1
MNNKKFFSLKSLLLIYLLVTIAFPVLILFSNIRGEHIQSVFSSQQFWPMLQNSLITTLSATVISVTLSFFLAWLLNRSNIRFKSIFVVLFTIPMLIPSISHGMGLVLLFGDNGLITNLLGINIGLYGYPGIIMGSVLYSFPVSFLMFHDSFQYEDYTIYEAASVLGLSKWKQFLTITMPSMRRTMLSAVLAVFTMVFTDYGVPLMTGGTDMTLPVYMYREVIGMMNFSNGAVIGILLLLPAVAAFLLDLKNSGINASSSTVTKSYLIEPNKKRDILVYVIFGVVLILICLPIIAFICLSFVKQYPIDMSFSLDTITKLFSDGIGMYFINSLAIALLTALFGTCLSYFSAYITARSKKSISNKMLHFISMLSLAVPGIVLGLSFALTFKNMPFYSTIFILVLVNIVHFFSSPYLLAYNSLSKFNPNLEDVSQALGISRFKMLFSVYIPCTKATIVEMYSYFFVNAMITISAVSFLVNFRTMPLALLIPQLESQSFIEGTALVSLLILVINLIGKAIVFFVKRSISKGENQNSNLLSERD